MPSNFLSPSETQSIVDKALQLYVPAGHKNALVGTVDANGLQFLTTFKLDEDHWAVTGVARHSWTGDNQLSASLVYSW